MSDPKDKETEVHEEIPAHPPGREEKARTPGGITPIPLSEKKKAYNQPKRTSQEFRIPSKIHQFTPKAPPPKDQTPEPSEAPLSDDTQEPLTKSDREERIVCSFPGLMKILVPEESFVPVPVAVRVANLSAGGAMVEAHDTIKINERKLLTNRYFELKVAHTEIPDLRGRIAWTDFSDKHAVLGLACFERSEVLAEIVANADSQIQWEGPPPLPPPKLDPYPPTTSERQLVITGNAEDAIEVVAKRDNKKFRANVHNGMFKLLLELTENVDNRFFLRSHAGERKSRAVPVRIAYEKGVRSRSFYFDARLKDDRENSESKISLDFQGSVRQAERVLYRFSQLLSTSERVRINAELTTRAGFDRRLFETLKSEGAVLASDSTSNNSAAKLLDELL